jgi:F0F1-type ATP synthase assembly protein I
MKKLLFHPAVILLVLFVVFGFAGPILISMPDTIAVLGGLTLVVATIYYVAKAILFQVSRCEIPNDSNHKE